MENGTGAETTTGTMYTETGYRSRKHIQKREGRAGWLNTITKREKLATKLNLTMDKFWSTDCVYRFWYCSTVSVFAVTRLGKRNFLFSCSGLRH